jgi:glycosyltransferase involved in cell wall biosynthesis
MRDYIRFTGRLSDVEDLVNAFDVGVLCANPDLREEGIPNAVMEYMALGVPAVVAAGGGVG